MLCAGGGVTFWIRSLGAEQIGREGGLAWASGLYTVPLFG